MPFVVTIDGPAGAGKSTVARALARRLGWRYLDTGAMYRAVTLAGLEGGLDPTDGPSLARLARELPLEMSEGGRTLIAGRDVSEAIRSERVTAAVSAVSAHPGVRAAMTELQRRVAEGGDLVCEGRDMGTVVFPAAAVKVYLDADPRTRARRRQHDLAAAGEAVDLEALVRRLEERDRADAARANAPLARAADQIHVDTSAMSVEDVVAELHRMVRARVARAR